MRRAGHDDALKLLTLDLISPARRVEQRQIDALGLACAVIRYDDMQRAPLATFTRAVQFPRAPDDPARIEKALEFSRFDTLAQMERERGFRDRSPRTGSFFRKGTPGGWRNTLTPQQVRAIVDAHGPVMRRFG